MVSICTLENNNFYMQGDRQEIRAQRIMEGDPAPRPAVSEVGCVCYDLCGALAPSHNRSPHQHCLKHVLALCTRGSCLGRNATVTNGESCVCVYLSVVIVSLYAPTES